MQTLVYVGTYTEPIPFGTGQGKGKGIHVYDLDSATGALSPRCTMSGVTNPSYLAFDPRFRFAFAVNELEQYEGKATGTVSSFAVDPATGNLTFLSL